MPRRVFFSFDYDDIMRVNIVRKSDTINRQHDGVGFYDKSLWEAAKKESDLAIKRTINSALHGSSVTCVLIGDHTWKSRWVRYEMFKSFLRGNGIFGVEIHNVGIDRLSVGSGNALYEAYAESERQSRSGLDRLLRLNSNPFKYVGFNVDTQGRVALREKTGNRWQQSESLSDTIRVESLPYTLPPKQQTALLSLLAKNYEFSELFSVKNWKSDDGFNNFASWVESAARQAKRW